MKLVNVEQAVADPLSRKMKLVVNVEPEDKQAVIDLVKKINEGKRKYTLSMNPVKRQRSLSANAYAWVLMQKIAEVLRTSKEEVYRQEIQKVGSFNIVRVMSYAAERFVERWHANGLGWVAEPMSTDGETTDIAAYYGSSTYDRFEMGRLIDDLVEEAKGLGIETMTPTELEGLKESWK